MDSINIVENFPSYMNHIKNSTYQFIPKLITSIIIFIIFITIANIFKQYFSFRHIKTQVMVGQEGIEISGEESTNVAYQQLEFIIYYLTIAFGIFVSLVNLGIQTNTILAILGIFVVGIGLSLQTTINNIWAGIYISFNKLFRIGDLIEIGNIKGYVQSFSLFNTVIIHTDKKVPVVIPNLQIQTGVLTNYSVNKIYS